MKQLVPTYSKPVLTVLFIIILIVYAYFQAQDFINGPTVVITSPSNGASLDESLIEIKGSAQHISHITLNGRQIFTDEAGLFSEQLLLAYGYNIITIEARDRFDRTTKEVLELVYK